MNGMSNLFRRSDVARLGGLTAFDCYIAEDYHLSMGLTSLGLSTELIARPAVQLCSRGSLPAVYARHLRYLLTALISLDAFSILSIHPILSLSLSLDPLPLSRYSL